MPFGFNFKFCKWIEVILNSAHISISVNGALHVSVILFLIFNEASHLLSIKFFPNCWAILVTLPSLKLL